MPRAPEPIVTKTTLQDLPTELREAVARFSGSTGQQRTVSREWLDLDTQRCERDTDAGRRCLERPGQLEPSSVSYCTRTGVCSGWLGTGDIPMHTATKEAMDHSCCPDALLLGCIRQERRSPRRSNFLFPSRSHIVICIARETVRSCSRYRIVPLIRYTPHIKDIPYEKSGPPTRSNRGPPQKIHCSEPRSQ